HDTVLLDDADEQNDADHGHQAEVEAIQHQRADGAGAGGGISRGTVRSEAWNACALPWNVPIREAGMRISRSACWIAAVAVPSDPPCARLKLMVTAGNWP